VELALKNAVGRQGLLLAAEAAVLLGEEMPNQRAVEAALLNPAHGAALWEPDLLGALARVVFGFPNARDVSRTGAHRAVVSELVLFSRRSRWEREHRRPTAAAREALGRLGLDTEPNNVTGLVLWQAVLWQLAADLDAPATAEALAGHWLPPYKEINGTIRVVVPIPHRGLEAWKHQIKALAQLRLTDETPWTLSARNGQLSISSSFAVVALSPWLTRSPQRDWEFPRGKHGLALLRLMAAASCAADLLETPTVGDAQHLLGLTLHAWEILNGAEHRLWLEGLHHYASTDRETASMSVQLSGLALFLWRRVKRIGAGETEQMRPAAISEYLLRRNLSSGERPIRSQALRLSYDFVHDGLSGSIPGQSSGQGRWRESADPRGRSHAERVLQELATSRNVFDARRASAQLRVHFDVLSNRAPTLGRSLRGLHGKAPNLWLVLAAKPLEGQELDSPELVHCLDHHGRDDLSFPLAVATARLHAVLSGVAVGAGRYDDWLNEWGRLVATVSDRTHLPRPLRLFMLELLGRPLAGTDPERRAMEDLVDAEVEFGLGTPLDRWTLFERLGAGSGLPPDFAQFLRLRMLRALYFWRTRIPRHSDIRDPGEVLREATSDALLERLLVRFILDVGRLPGELAGASVAEVVPRLWRETRQPAGLRELQVDLGAGAVDPGWSDLDRRLMVGAAVDPMTDQLRVHLRRRPALRTAMGEALVDGWRLPTARLRHQLDAARSTSVVGVVAARQDTRTWVNVGLDQPLLWERSLAGADLGDLVAVTVESLAGGLSLLKEDSVQLLGTMPSPGDVQDATVEIDRRRTPASVTVRLASESFELEQEQSERVRRRWMPDIVGLLTDKLRDDVNGAGGVLSYRAIAHRDGEQWLPMDLGQPEFFAHLAGNDLAGNDKERPVRLVLVGGVGAGSARYSIAPGHNVVLPHTAWTDGAGKVIEGTLRSLGTDAHGLVLYAWVEADGDRTPRLALDGERPLDDRAQRWRRVFDDNADFEAQLDPASGRLMMEHDIPGFPRIAVEVKTDDTVCRFTPKAWTDLEQRRAEVDGEPSPHRQLKVGEPSIDTLRRLLDLRDGEVVRLDRILLSSPPRRGARLGRTAEGLSVNVEAESIHFSELGTDSYTASGFVRNRRAVVTRVRPLRPRGAARPVIGVPDHRLLASVSDQADRAAAEDHLLRVGTLRGLVTDAPQKNQHDDDLFRVWLDVGGIVVPITLYRREFEHPPEREGVLVTAERASGEAWRFTAYGRYIQVRPLWKLVEATEPPPPGAIFLGVIGWNQNLWMLSQLPLRGSLSRDRQPTLHVYPLQGGAPPTHLADRTSGRTAGGAAGWRGPAYELADGQVELHDPVDGGRRAVVNIDRGKGHSVLLAGEVRGVSSGVDARVDRVQMSISQLPSGEVFARRVFVLSEQDYGRAETARPVQAGEDESAGYRDYRAGDQRPLPVTLDGDGRHVTLRTAWKVPAAGGWGFRLPLATGEAPWVDQRYLDSEVQVVLLEESGQLVAGYRQVPPLELAEAVPLFQRQGMIPGARWEPRQRLYYVDRRVTAAGVVHRFEWGYGYTMQVPEDRMTVGGRQAPDWPVTPFHSDWIRELLVSDAGRGRGPVLDIAIDAIDARWFSHLYADADKGVVTPADIEAADDGTNPRIAAVYVRWRRDPGAAVRYRDDHRVELKGVRLSGPAAETITQAWREHGGGADTDRSRRAFLRLNRRRFEESGGRQAEFDFVRPELGGRNGLDRDAFVFLEAGVIERLPNDVQLLLHTGEVLGQRGQGFTVKVRRRDFSQRQNLLRELYASDDPGQRRGAPPYRSQAVAGDVYLVRLRNLFPAEGWAGGKIRDGLHRPVSALRGHVLANDAPCLASVQPWRDGFALEIRPNVLFRLDRADIASCAGTGDGAIVRVTAERGATTRRGRLVLQPVLRGDAAFVPPEGRPALLLPMQDLLSNKDDLDGALRKGSYTVAGLPSLTIPAIPRASGGGGPTEPGEFARSLLTTEHPKIATIHVDRANSPGGMQVRYGPPDPEVLAGRLVLREDGTLGCRDPAGRERRIPWSSVSYADDGTERLRSRCERLWWQYHDFTTSHRSPTPPHKPTAARRLPSIANAIEEPAFFSEGWSLRHPDRRSGGTASRRRSCWTAAAASSASGQRTPLPACPGAAARRPASGSRRRPGASSNSLAPCSPRTMPRSCRWPTWTGRTSPRETGSRWRSGARTSSRSGRSACGRGARGRAAPSDSGRCCQSSSATRRASR
jgi:hypothetical protein